MKPAPLALLILLLAGARPALGGSEHFRDHHPDLHHAELALERLDSGDASGAMEHLLVASRFASKGAQALVAELYWEGRGVPQDRALGYAWMDLAAERGYPLLVAKRELYWQALTESERTAATSRGVAIYDEYGDAAAKPRVEKLLRDGVRDAVGSRVGGSYGSVDVFTNVSKGMLGDPIQGTRRTDYYAGKYWRPADYWSRVDLEWRQLPEGIVEVQELTPRNSSKPLPKENGERR